MIKRYYVGLDVSTQGTKLVLLDYASKRPLFVTVVNYDKDLQEYNTENGVIKGRPEGVSESDPKMWIKAVDIVFERLKNSGHDSACVRAISVSGQQHGLVSLDAEGNLTRKTSKLWNDVSTVAECAEITEKCGGKAALIASTWNVLKPGYTAGKILHFKKEDPDGFRRTTTFFLVHNYINWYLTGGKKGGVRAMEPGDASGVALMNPENKQWAVRVCNAIDPQLIAKLLPVKPADEFIGTISKELSARYGFPADCRIDAGSGDNMYGAVGTGNVRPGLVTLSLGTSGTACTLFNSVYRDSEGEIASFCDSFGQYMALLCVSNLANGYNKIVQSLNITHEEFSRLITKTAPGNGGRVLIPWYTGERTPDMPSGAPVYFGFGLDDFTPERLSRAVLEGHVMNLYEGFCRLQTKADALFLTGGIAQSPAWRQCIADIFGRTVVPVKGEGAALGAAVHAAYVDNKTDVGADGVYGFVRPFIEYDEANRTAPNPAVAEKYESFKRIYLALSARARGVAGAGDPFALRRSFVEAYGTE
ncbi:MAG: FGGY family carbohydrate kinase [Fibrobacterota bacterium]